jgi:hypothetical protein
MHNDRVRPDAACSDDRGISNDILVCDWIGPTAAHQDIVCCVLYPDSGSMECAGCLRENFGKEKAIRDLLHSTKNQIQTHLSPRKNQEFVFTLDSH